MNYIPRDIFQKLVVLYLISKFPNGLYGKTRFQKVLYFALKDSKIKPFSYKHTGHGQYSSYAKNALQKLAVMGHVKEKDMDNSRHEGKHWELTNTSHKNIKELIKALRPQHNDILRSIDKSYNKYGKMRNDNLYTEAHKDEALSKVKSGNCIFEMNVPEQIAYNATVDKCEEISLSFNQIFVKAVGNLIEGIDGGKIDTSNWRTID